MTVSKQVVGFLSGSKIRSLLQSKFLRDGATLASACVFVQALSLVTSPIMARLYGPEAYGLLGLYVSITGITGVAAHLQYHCAMVLPKDDIDALALMKGGLGLSIATCLLLSLYILLPIQSWLSGSQYESILPWIPLIISMTIPGTLITFAGIWLTRKQRFSLLSVMRIVTNVSSMVIAIGFGFWFKDPSGLIWANVFGMLIGGFVLGYGMHQTNALGFFRADTVRALNLLREYKDFPLYTVPTQFLMQLSRQSPVLLLTGFAGASAVGFFNMSNRLLGLPNVLFAESIGTVFTQRAAKLYAEQGECKELYRKMFWGLLLTTTPCVMVLSFIAPALFAYVLGERWRVAGEYSQILCWLFAVQIVCTPLSAMMMISRRQREDMLLQIVSCMVTVGLMYAGYHFYGTAKAMLAGFTIAATCTQLYYGVRGFWLSAPIRGA